MNLLNRLTLVDSHCSLFCNAMVSIDSENLTCLNDGGTEDNLNRILVLLDFV